MSKEKTRLKQINALLNTIKKAMDESNSGSLHNIVKMYSKFCTQLENEDTSEYIIQINELEEEKGSFYVYQDMVNNLRMIKNTIDCENAEEEKMNEMNNVESLKTPMNNKVFIVHGHDELLLTQVTLLLTQLKLNPIVLKDEPNGGLQSILDKLIQNADVGYAIVLFTPDDMGYTKSEKENIPKTRARQNVVLELGYFVGKLGKDRVCFLNNGVEELSSDITGIAYSDGLDWKYKIVDELKTAGYSVSKDDVK